MGRFFRGNKISLPTPQEIHLRHAIATHRSWGAGACPAEFSQALARQTGSSAGKVKGLQASERAAELVKSVVQSAYERVERDQVADVSKSMTILFSNMVGQTDDGLISEVGLRTTDPASSLPQYELFARFQNADKPLKLINGASRRALSVAFVLALAEQTGNRVPLVTDSLLHSTSGEVRKRLVEFLATGKRIGQPIIFGALEHKRA